MLTLSFFSDTKWKHFLILIPKYMDRTVNIFILKAIHFILQKMVRSLHTSSPVVHIKSTVNIQIIRGLLHCYSIVKYAFKYFYLTIFMAMHTNIMNKTIKILYINY